MVYLKSNKVFNKFLQKELKWVFFISDAQSVWMTQITRQQNQIPNSLDCDNEAESENPKQDQLLS